MKFTWKNQDFTQITLKKFLKHQGISHRMFNSAKHDGEMYLNKNRIETSCDLKIGDQVEIDLPPEASDPNVETNYHPIDVIFEDKNWLVVNKPAGLTSVPGPSNRFDTLVNRVKGYLEQRGVEDLRPHIITRLDRFTSGVVLIAKHRLANSLANQLSADHQIQKQYVAIISGHLDDAHGNIKMPIGKNDDEIKRHRMEDGQSAWTEYWVVDSFADFSLVQVTLHTGRTHQIRVHFNEINHPLIGDYLYGGLMDLGIERQTLHASDLSFLDPFTQKKLSFHADLAEDMQKFIEKIRRNKNGR